MPNSDSIFATDPSRSIARQASRTIDRLKSKPPRIERRVSDAVIVGQPRKKDPRQPALPSDTRPSPVGVVRSFSKNAEYESMCGAKALAQNQLRLRKMKRRMKLRAPCPLNAVIGPKRLRPIGNLDRIEMPLSLVHAGKGMVSRRMPVLGKNDVLESRRDPVNDVDDLVAIGDGKRATRTEIILNIDHDQHIRGSRLHHVLDI